MEYNTHGFPYFFPGEPPKVTRTRMVQELEGMQALLAARELVPGDRLYWIRLGVRHIADVLADGHLVFDGTPHSSPTAAAAGATGATVDGWEVWVCERDDMTLAAKRERIGLDPRYRRAS